MLQKVSQQQHITTMAYYTIIKSLSENCATESITATTHHHHGILHYSKVPLRELCYRKYHSNLNTSPPWHIGTIVKSPSENCATESITATTHHHHHGILHYSKVPLRELCYRKYHSNNTSPPWHITL